MSKDKCDNNCRDLCIYRKTTKAFDLIFTKNNCPVDITGYTIFFTVKQRMSDLDASALISKDITSHIDPLGGKTVITLSQTDTDINRGSYYYDIKYKDPNNESNIIVHGRLQIKEPVTTRG